MTLLVDGYKATQTKNTLIIHDVPIFCETERDGVEFDVVWVNQAMRYAMQQQQEGYMPPLHVRHHKQDPFSDDPTACGFFQVKGIRQIIYKGQGRAALMADLHINNAEVAEDILMGKLPYRSVEIDDYRKPAIDGLALLDHDAPYLELPMLMVGNVEERSMFSKSWNMEVTDLKTNRREVFCFSKEGNKARIMLSIEQPVDGVVDNDGGESGTHAVDTEPETKQESMTKDEKVKMEKSDGDDKEKSVKMEEESGGLETSAVISAIESGQIPIADFDAIANAMATYQASVAPAVDEADAAPAATPDGESMSKEETKNFAKMQGRIDGLEAKVQARDEAEAIREDVSAAFEKLRVRPMGSLDALKEKLTNFRTKFSKEAFDVYVEEMELSSTAPIKGDKTDEIDTDNLPEEVMAYHDQGNEAVELAMNFAKQHERLKNSGSKVSLKRYIEINMKRETA